MKNIIIRLIEILTLPKFNTTAALFSIFAFVFGAMMVGIGNNVFSNGQIPIAYLVMTKFIFYLFLGFSGFIIMVRAELHQIVVIRGKLARIIGLFWCLFSWWMAISSIATFFK